jgi:transcription termination factor Rho
MADKICGILRRVGKGQLVIRSPERSYRTGPKDVPVPPQVTQRLGLRQGASVEAQVEKRKGKTKLVSVDRVGGVSPEDFRRRPRYPDLVAVDGWVSPREASRLVGAALLA